MRLAITHTSEYSYEQPLPYALQRIRLSPRDDASQRVVDWSIAIEGAKEEVRFLDQFGNDTRLLSVTGGPHTVRIVASGQVDTTDNAGVNGPNRGFAPLWLFMPPTSLTAPGERIEALAGSIGEGEALERLHRLMAAIGKAVAYQPGTTDVATAAEDALARGTGVCQDHAHVFAAAARRLGFPARYVSGYLLMEGTTAQAASHAWAEAHVDGLGWVGFDAANDMCPDDRYVRLATGRDYRDAMPVSGIILGAANERLAVAITVEQ